MKKRFLSVLMALSFLAQPLVVVAQDVQEDNPLELIRIQGENRYDTAVQISKTLYDKNDYAIIASGETFVDALVSGALSAQEEMPILLVQKDMLSHGVLEELVRLNPDKVFIVGGPATVSEEIEKTIQDKGLKTERLAGKDRQETAIRIEEKRYDFALETLRKTDKEAMILGDLYAMFNAYDYPDALAAAPLMGQMPTIPFLPYMGKDGAQPFIIFGGTESVPHTQGETMGLTSRLAGRDRYETAVEIAKVYGSKAFDSLEAIGYELESIVLVNGSDYPDALASAALARANKGAILLTKPQSLPHVTKDYITSNPKIKKVIIVGGEEAISKAVEEDLKLVRLAD